MKTFKEFNEGLKTNPISNGAVVNQFYPANKAFSFSLVSLDGKLEQENDLKRSFEKTTKHKVKIGDMVSGYELNSRKKLKGRVVSIFKDDEGEIEYFTIEDTKHKKQKKISADKIKLFYPDGQYYFAQMENLQTFDEFTQLI